MKKYILVVVIAFLSGVAGSAVYHALRNNNELKAEDDPAPAREVALPTEEKQLPEPSARSLPATVADDFVLASSKSTASVVYVKNISETSYGNEFFNWFFGERTGQSISSGSGVIFSSDGYIVTNNHVIENANQIEVTFNRRTYPAQLIGTDPSTDLAVLKIEEGNLPAIQLGSSRTLQVGEWVLAVGNPFDLNSTVTAGIVSAKGRQINYLKDKFPIESFIQTDAAINPGNSGGALVNSKGELVGINTVIKSMTGSYIGYGFAVPVDIVKKVVRDIIEFGEVQKAFTGMEVLDLDADLANRLDLDIDIENIRGVLVSYIQKDGAAAGEGISEGDILLTINGEEINTKSDFEEVISYFSPGDKIAVEVNQNGDLKKKSIVLLNREGTTELLKREVYTSGFLGAEFEVVPKVERDLIGIDHGIRVLKVKGGLFGRLGIDKEFIITSVNGTPVKTPEKLVEILEEIRGRVRIEGVTPGGRRGYYSFYY